MKSDVAPTTADVRRARGRRRDSRTVRFCLRAGGGPKSRAELVWQPKFPVIQGKYREFLRSWLGLPKSVTKRWPYSRSYDQTPYAAEQGINYVLSGNQIGISGKFVK